MCPGVLHTRSSSAALSPAPTVPKPSAKQRGAAGLDSQNPATRGSPRAQQLPGECHHLPPQSCICREHPHAQGRLASGHTSSRSQGCKEGTNPAWWDGGLWEVGSGLLSPLGLTSPPHRGTGMMGASLSPSPTMFQPEHRPYPCMVPAVFKEPGLGPRRPSRRWLGPTEGPAGTWELRGRVQSSPQKEAKECAGNFIQLEMDLDRVLLLWSCPWPESPSSQWPVSLSWPRHVTVYRSSRWFLQIW